MISKKTPIKKRTSQTKFFFSSIFIAIVAIILYLVLENYFVKKEEIKLPPPMTKIEFNKEGELSFLDSNGNFKTKIDIEIADNEIKQTRGLMFRTELKENQGMLFIFDKERYQSFWMKNTPISLDIFFVNSKSEIVSISEYAEPYSENHYVSKAPAQYVVETIAGFAQKYKIKPGDRIVWRRIFE
jgi:hypothetical protein